MSLVLTTIPSNLGRTRLEWLYNYMCGQVAITCFYLQTKPFRYWARSKYEVYSCFNRLWSRSFIFIIKRCLRLFALRTSAIFLKDQYYCNRAQLDWTCHRKRKESTRLVSKEIYLSYSYSCVCSHLFRYNATVSLYRVANYIIVVAPLISQTSSPNVITPNTQYDHYMHNII